MSGEDNRDLLDDGKSQALTDDDIEVLKSEGLSSTQLIETIVENSKTYSQKTQFSQHKYIRKKQKKHQDWLLATKPSIRLLAEMYYLQDPLSIM